MLTKDDSESFSLTLTDYVACLKKNKTDVAMIEKHFVTSNSQKTLRKTALGWEVRAT